MTRLVQTAAWWRQHCNRPFILS